MLKQTFYPIRLMNGFLEFVMHGYIGWS